MEKEQTHEHTHHKPVPFYEKQKRKLLSLRHKSLKELWHIFHKPLLILGASMFAIVLIIPIITYFVFAQDISNKDRILNRNNSGLTLLDRDGKPFFSFNQPKTITYTSLDNIPAVMQNAVVAAEDRDFYTNPGFSIRGIARAIRENFEARGIRQGGSTISQELVKNALLTSERSFLRKYQEVILSIELNRRYSKQDILELYLNAVYFGEGAFGIENAAQAYFGIPASKLTLAQSALLTGLLPAPSALSPLSNDPAKAKKRQALVLDSMVPTKYITQAEATAAKNEALRFNPKPKENINTLAPHFALMVKEDLIKKYGEEAVIRSGFEVKTTLHRKWQQYAETTVANQVKNLAQNDVTNGAAVVLDPKNGEILVMVGSASWDDEISGKINMAIRPRQPGSSFKPLMYAEAIEQRLITPATILDDKPITFPGNYQPQNYDRKFRGPVTVRRALANSLNIPAILVMQKLGVSEGISFAKKAGITTLKDDNDYGLSLVLGAGEVELLELTGVYAAFASQGRRYTPSAILSIEDKYGKSIYNATPDFDDVVSEGTAFLISSILSDNNARSETFGNLLTVSRPAAVKTGTTDDYKDSLTVGYTPNLAIGVWVGNNANTPMDRIAGSIGAAPIWRLLMNQFLASLPRETFQKPFGVEEKKVCPYKGLESSFATGSAITEFFLSGTDVNDCEEPTPTTGPTNTPEPSQQPTDTPAPTPTNTPEATGTPVPTPTSQPTPTPAVQLPTQSPTITISP